MRCQVLELTRANSNTPDFFLSVSSRGYRDLSLGLRTKKVIIFVFTILEFFMVKLSFQILNCRVKQSKGPGPTA